MQPLAHTKIVSIAFNLPGPAAVWQLCQWGAQVLKVEPPAGDPLGLSCPDLYGQLVAGQQIVRWNLKAPADRAALDEQLVDADLLVSSTLPASLARMHLDWPGLHARFPRLCQVAIVGYAPPDEERTGHDLTYQASVGLLAPPALPLTLLADMAGAQAAISHALAVLAERQRTAQGVFSLVPIAAALGFYALPLQHGLTLPGGQLGGGLPCYNIYPTADGWLAVAALEPKFWSALRELLQLQAGTYEELRAIFATRSAQQWQRWAEEHRLPLAAVQAPGVS
jgi:crotonobetainyl-CoA:carnitine CoA-transferase CaiB-like acyl-CoA transferase